MDSDFRLDIDEIIHTMETAEVISLYFPLLRKAVLIDTRSDSVEGPLIRVVGMVDSIEERFRSLRRMRPRFSRPESVTVIPWPKYVATLLASGIWERVARRFADAGQASAVKACQVAIMELGTLEREELHNAITGERYHSLWEAKGRGTAS